ncbi:efflux transporter outer membrane subunit [Erythrobacter sp. GH1-10]|uniref:efflux transporter outer membrane subunit n=1 Tax=Erythrobacter sp. GH1-10 TaxID=3349334 RepID=UPI003878092B
MRNAALLIASAAALTACVGPSIPDAEPSAGIAIPTDFLAETRPASGLDDYWWRGFEDEELNRLVERALEDNQSLEAARQRLNAARAIVAAEESEFFPTVDAEAAGGIAVDDAGSSSDSASLAVEGVWTIDLNGRLSAERAAALADAQGAAFFVAERQRLIASAVADQFVELKRTAARLRLLDQSTELQQQTLQIVTLRYEAGLSSNFDVRRAAADLARTQAQRGPLLLARTRAANALSVLTGNPPSPMKQAEEDVAVPRYRQGPEIGLPADLVRRRPDLLLAEAEVARAAAGVGIERADLAPSFVLRGVLSSGSGGFDGLFSSALASLAASLGLPLIDGGRRKAEVRAAESELQAALADYRQNLLEVFADVEGALVSIQSAEDRQSELRRAVRESEAAFDQSNALYREGLASLFDVLDVQRQLISSREALIDGESDLAQAHIALFAAVGAPTDTGSLSGLSGAGR